MNSRNENPAFSIPLSEINEPLLLELLRSLSGISAIIAQEWKADRRSNSNIGGVALEMFNCLKTCFPLLLLTTTTTVFLQGFYFDVQACGKYGIRDDGYFPSWLEMDCTVLSAQELRK